MIQTAFINSISGLSMASSKKLFLNSKDLLHSYQSKQSRQFKALDALTAQRWLAGLDRCQLNTPKDRSPRKATPIQGA